jgi:RNA polymerase subunit RPABC4/transcription elongation factor Spt4
MAGKCRNCGQPINPDWTICPACGMPTRRRPRARHCPRCGARVYSDLVVCPSCGTDLEEGEAAWWLPAAIALAVLAVLFVVVRFGPSPLNLSLPSFDLRSLAFIAPTSTPTMTVTPTVTPSATNTPTATMTPRPTFTPTPTQTPTPLPTDTPTRVPVTPTDTPIPTVTPTPTPPFAAPVLLSPADRSQFTGSTDEMIDLVWKPVGQLADNEFYALRLRWKEGGKTAYGGTNIRESEWRVPTSMYGKADLPDRAYEWEVTVYRRVTGADGKTTEIPISPVSKTWVFYWP